MVHGDSKVAEGVGPAVIQTTFFLEICYADESNK